MAEKKSKITGHLAALGAYVIFGLNVVFCKDIANYSLVPPIVLFTLRAAGASLLFWFVSLFLPKEKVEKRDFPKIVIASLLGFFTTQLTFLKGITMATAIDAAIIGTLSPIFTMIIAAIAIKEPISFKKAGGVALSLAGILYLIFNSFIRGNGVEQSSPMGIFLLLINSLSFAAYLGIFRPLISKYGSVTFMKWIFLTALVISLPFSTESLLNVDFSAIPSQVIFEIGYLIVFATFVAYFLIPVGQKRIRPTLVSMYSYVQPIITAIISIAVGLDTFSWQKGAATFLVISGVLLVNSSRSAK